MSPQHPRIRNTLPQPPHQPIVVDPVEEFLQVHVPHHPLPFLNVPLCLAHRRMRVAPRSEAVAVLGETRVEYRWQDL